jgi:ketosteroid isomerase-like protein
MKKKSISLVKKFLITLCITTGCLNTNMKAQSANEKAIRQLLSHQTKAWNAGNIEAFMEGYWESDSLVFIGKNGPSYGYKTTLENYKKGYPDKAAMGKLTFNLLQLKQLSPQYYFVIGKWHLQRSIGDVEGHFTLLFRKIKNKWYIISDHSS